jgi:DNA-binding transcriptional regulator GbsR (MarR family)
MDPEARRKFVDAWGHLGAAWGVNRTVARVHALLMASEGPLSLDDLCDELAISKGNASMSLRELRALGVVRPVQVPGDRRDWYVTEPDVWAMFFRIAAERKRRELDPAVDAVRKLLEGAGAEGSVRRRLAELEDLLATLDVVGTRMLANPAAARTAVAFLAGFPGAARKRRPK